MHRFALVFMAFFAPTLGIAQDTTPVEATVPTAVEAAVQTAVEPLADTGAADPFPIVAGDMAVLDDYLWVARPLVVFADNPADPRFGEQMALLAERAEALVDRDIVVIADTDPRNLSDVRKTLRPRGFMLALVGKDGRVVFRKPAPWDVREITRAVDKQPLRKQEIQARRAAGAGVLTD